MNLRSPSHGKKEYPNWLKPYDPTIELTFEVTRPRIYIVSPDTKDVGVLTFIIISDKMYPFWFLPENPGALESDYALSDEFELVNQEDFSNVCHRYIQKYKGDDNLVFSSTKPLYKTLEYLIERELK